jgi:hypothetical protein
METAKETAKENSIAMVAALMMVAGLIVFIMNRPPRPDPLDVNKVERALCMADILVPAQQARGEGAGRDR